jgi:hypothetical protein
MFASCGAECLGQACQGSVLKRLDRSHVLVHQLARFSEIESDDEAIQDHVSLLVRERRESRGDLAESKALVDGIQRVDGLGSLDVTPFDLRMSVLRPEVIHDLAVCDLEEPGHEFALGPAAESIEPAMRAEVNLLEEVLRGGLDAEARQEVTENSAIGCLIQPGERGSIPPARSVQQFGVFGRALVLI